MPNPGISAVIHVEGFHPAWDGSLMVTSLRGQTLLRVRRWDTGNYVEPIYIGDRIRDIDIISRKWSATDGSKLILLDPIKGQETSGPTQAQIQRNVTALESCGACHNVISATSTNNAPYLLNIVGRRIASASDFTHYQRRPARRGDAQLGPRFAGTVPARAAGLRAGHGHARPGPVRFRNRRADEAAAPAAPGAICGHVAGVRPAL